MTIKLPPLAWRLDARLREAPVDPAAFARAVDTRVYVYHGSNTSGRTHFKKRLFAHAQPLGPEEAKRVRAALSGEAAQL